MKVNGLFRCGTEARKVRMFSGAGPLLMEEAWVYNAEACAGVQEALKQS